jgi:hypothetical protein
MLSTILIAIFALLIGVAALLAGYRFFLILLPIWGLFAGLWLGATAVTTIFGQGFLATVTGWVVGIVVGLIFAVLSYLFYIVGVAILAASAGYWLGTGLMTAIGFDPGILVFIVGFIAAIVIAGIVILFNVQKYVVIAITALGGSTILLSGILLLFGKLSIDQLGAGLLVPLKSASPFWLLIWLVVAVVGFVFQVQTTRSYEMEPRK